MNDMKIYDNSIVSDATINTDVPCDNVSKEIPGYEHDLHKRYAVYSFSNNINQPISISFSNRRLQCINLILKLMGTADYEKGMRLQADVVNGIKDNNSKNIFEGLSSKGMFLSLKDNIGIGLFDEEELVAQLNLLINPLPKDNLILDLLPEIEVSQNSAIIDYVVVKKEYRGYDIQNTLIFAAECIAKKYGKDGICAVTSPFNVNSLRNFISQGYKVVATLPKYKSERHYLWKELN